jgi:hypothetical protein
VVHLVSSSIALAFLTNMSEKRRSASPSAIQVNNRRKTIGIEEQLDVISRLEKGERIVDIRNNVRLTHSSIPTIRDNAYTIKESGKSGTKVFVCVARLPQSYPNELGIFVFNLQDVFQQRNPDVKRELPVMWICKSWSSHSGNVEDSSLLGCYAVLSGMQFLGTTYPMT